MHKPRRQKMSPEGKGTHRKTGRTASSRPAIPADVTAAVLSHLPVKTLLRFRCVCNAWLELISESKFISQHLNRSPASLLIYAMIGYQFQIKYQPQSQPQPQPQAMAVNPPSHVISLYEVLNPRREAHSTLVRLTEYPRSDASIIEFLEVMVCPNGLVCLVQDPFANEFTLWNPATRIFKHVTPLPGIRPQSAFLRKVSFGIGFDPSPNEYKIVRILQYEQRYSFLDRAEVYSLKSGWWRGVELSGSVRFVVSTTKCEVVVKGLPYWGALVYVGLDRRFALLYFDVQEEVFRTMPVPWAMEDREACAGAIKGCIGVMVWDDGTEMSSDRIVDVWMREEEGEWRLIYRVGQMPVVGRILGFYGDRGIVQEVGDEGDLVMYNLEKMEVEDFVRLEDAMPGTLDAVVYRETLVDIPGSEETISTQFLEDG